jgi:hypothetical protein
MSMKVSALAYTYTVLIAMLVSACAAKLDRPERFAAVVLKYGSDAGSGNAAPPACALQIFKATCGLAGCHAKGSPQIDLASDGVAGRLIEQRSRSVTCMDRVYIATDGTASLLLNKLTDSPPCGAKMPLGGMISVSDKQCLTDWVTQLGRSESDAGGL